MRGTTSLTINFLDTFVLSALTLYPNPSLTGNKIVSEKGAPARKHRHGGWGALGNRHFCSPTQDLMITACPSKTDIDGIDSKNGIFESFVSPMCSSSVEGELSSHDRTAVYSEVPGESADLRFRAGVNTVTLHYFSRHFSRHCEVVVKLWEHARCAYEHFQVFNDINGVNQDVFQIFDTFQGSTYRNSVCLLPKCTAGISDSGFSHIKCVLDSNAA